MKTSEVFKKAKGVLARNWVEAQWVRGEPGTREQFICIALLRLAQRKKIRYSDRYRCEQIINRLLGGVGTLESWLISQGHVPDEWSLTNEDRTKMQVTRHAWLRHLIAHYQSLGD